MSAPSQHPDKPTAWQLVLRAFLDAPDRTLTNAQLGEITGVQAFHQRISNLRAKGYVIAGAVRVKPGRYAYTLLGVREGASDVPATRHGLPLVGDPEAAVRAAEQSLRENPPQDTPGRRPIGRQVHDRSVADLEAQVRGLTERNAELEAQVEQLSGWRDGAPVTEGSLFIVFDGPPSAEAPRFVEVEDAEGGATRTLADWEPHPDAEGLHRLGPFYATPAEAQRAARPARQPRAERGPTGPQLMRQVLDEAGVPLHSKVIAERVLASGGDAIYKGKTPAATMAAQLATSNKDGGEFVKVAPGCFALRKWPEAKRDAEPVRA